MFSFLFLITRPLHRHVGRLIGAMLLAKAPAMAWLRFGEPRYGDRFGSTPSLVLALTIAGGALAALYLLYTYIVSPLKRLTGRGAGRAGGAGAVVVNNYIITSGAPAQHTGAELGPRAWWGLPGASRPPHR